MPDLNNRDEFEATIARKLGTTNTAALRAVLEKLGDPPDYNNLTPGFWEDMERQYRGTIAPVMEKVFTAAAETMQASSSIGVDWTLVNERAADFARNQALELVSDLNTRNRTLIRNAVGDFYSNGLTMGQLREKLSNAFSPVRAASIAATEVTRAAVQGELSYVNELRKQGARLVAVWQTSADSVTCPLCAPLNGKQEGDGWEIPPPRHPRCRCFLNYDVFDEGQAVATPTEKTQTLFGEKLADIGVPGKSEDSLNRFLLKSEGPLSNALRYSDDADMGISLLQQDFDSGRWFINKDAVRSQADIFLSESQEAVKFTRTYMDQQLRNLAKANGITTSDITELRNLYNQEYANRAKAILTSAEIGEVKLTDAQLRRLKEAAKGSYLNMVTDERSSRGWDKDRRKFKGGGSSNATAAAKAEQRRIFLEAIGNINQP